MSNSPLVSYTHLSPNCNKPRNNKILKITPHHMAGNGTLEGFGADVAMPSRGMSANYAIDSQGRIGLYVDESNRSWCSYNPSNDHQAITIEVANDGGAPNWHVSDAALDALIRLCVDICIRNGIPRLNYTGDANGNLTMHSMFKKTVCPGPYLKSKFPYIAQEVNKRLQGSAQPTQGDDNDMKMRILKPTNSVPSSQQLKEGCIVRKENGSAVVYTPHTAREVDNTTLSPQYEAMLAEMREGEILTVTEN